MKLRTVVQEEVFEAANGDTGVLNTGWTIDEIEADLDRREDVMDQLEEKVDSFSTEQKQYLEAALEAGPRETVRLYAKAKEAEMYKSFWSQLWENLMVQQFFLLKLLLEAKRRSLLTQPTGDLGFNLDIESLDVEAVRTALENSAIEQSQTTETIEALDVHLNQDSADALSLDLSAIRAEASELEAAAISGGEFELGSSLEEAIDDQIQAELNHERDRA